jgi:hypothetical protein
MLLRKMDFWSDCTSESSSNTKDSHYSITHFARSCWKLKNLYKKKGKISYKNCVGVGFQEEIVSSSSRNNQAT